MTALLKNVPVSAYDSVAIGTANQDAKAYEKDLGPGHREFGCRDRGVPAYVMLLGMEPRRRLICNLCRDRLMDAKDAIRRHETLLETAVEAVQKREPTDEEHQRYTVLLQETFNAAQSAWSLYRDHLTEHGTLPPSQSN